jgi:hypothetical protein
MLVFAIFPVALFFLGACLVTGLPVAAELQAYWANRGRRSVVCPDNGERADVEVDRKFALRTALRNHQETRLESCTRWPAQGECGQECLAQVDPSPENLDRLLTKWYQGKQCAICTRRLSPADWRRSRLAVLNQQHKLFELRHMHLDNLQAELQNMRPLCWNCHQQERARQAQPADKRHAQERWQAV